MGGGVHPLSLQGNQMQSYSESPALAMITERRRCLGKARGTLKSRADPKGPRWRLLLYSLSSKCFSSFELFTK